MKKKNRPKERPHFDLEQESGEMIRHSVFSMVDFPEPLEPIKVVMLPSVIFKSSPLKTASPLYPADKPFACICESIDILP